MPIPVHDPADFAFPRAAGGKVSDQDLVTTLFALGREVTAVLDLDELLQRIPTLIARLINFTAFAVYLVDDKHHDVRMAYSVGYPEAARAYRMPLGTGTVGRVIAEGTADEVRRSGVAFVEQFVSGAIDGPVPFHYPAAGYEADLGFAAAA